MIYLDYNATTPIAPEVLAAMRSCLEQHFGNPSSSHTAGKLAKAAIEAARGQVAAAIGAEPDEIIFTSGGTEASNQAIKGTLLREIFKQSSNEQMVDERLAGQMPERIDRVAGVERSEPPVLPHLIISAIEHPATVEPAQYLKRFGVTVSVVGCNANGVISPEEFSAALRPNTRLASIMHANNEIGSIQPIAELAEVCRNNNVLLHVDAAQSLGKIPVNVKELGADLLSIAGHKIYAPKGVGALYIRRGTPIDSFMHGAGHERGLRAGTENTPYVVALGKAMNLAAEYITSGRPDKLASLRDRLVEKLRAGIVEGLTINGAEAPRLPNTLSVNFPGVIGSELLTLCPEVCASTGAACHSGETRRSATLTAINLPPEIAAGTVRLSIGRGTTAAEIDVAAGMLVTAWQALRAAGGEKR